MILFERFIERYGLAAERLMKSGRRVARALGTLMALLAIACVGAVVLLWLLFGKKPR